MGAQVIDPHRGVHQDHFRPDCRRGGVSTSGSLPPSRAKRRALSRSMSALRASRTSFDFSFEAGEGLGLGDQWIVES